MASLILVAGCTAPVVVGAWSDRSPRDIERNSSARVIAIALSDRDGQGTVNGEFPANGPTADASLGSRHQSFVALGRGMAGSRIPDADAPVR